MHPPNRAIPWGGHSAVGGQEPLPAGTQDNDREFVRMRTVSSGFASLKERPKTLRKAMRGI
jgi:hypothetical protein